MAILAKFFALFEFLTKKLSVCANTGFMAGAIGGVFIQLDHSFNPGFHLTTLQELLIDSLLLTAVAWFFVVFVLCVIAKFTFLSIAVPSLVNSFLTCFITLFICNKFSLFPWGYVIGLLVGILVGTLLCKFNQILSTNKK